uniref:Helitron_like_N domain-containing protein n=1 Tax=Panagrellus redivivus TaxID=6233 RepID=A0A7E4VWV2_PANRE
MPSSQKFTCEIMTNDVRHGLLHIYIRHYPEIEQQVPLLKARRFKLPMTLQEKMALVNAAADSVTANAAITDFESELNLRTLRSTMKTLFAAQMMVLSYLQRIVDNQTAVRTIVQGRYQLRYPLKAGTELVLGPSDAMNAVTSFNDPRRVRYIVTAYIC